MCVKKTMWHEMNQLFTKYMKYGSMNSIFRVFFIIQTPTSTAQKPAPRYIIKYRAKTTEEMSTTKQNYLMKKANNKKATHEHIFLFQGL